MQRKGADPNGLLLEERLPLLGSYGRLVANRTDANIFGPLHNCVQVLAGSTLFHAKWRSLSFTVYQYIDTQADAVDATQLA